MQCPKCGSYQHRTHATHAADKFTDGTVHRIRKCTESGCGYSWRTHEIHSTAFISLTAGIEPKQPPPPPAPSTNPLAQALNMPLTDIEHEMEDLLAPAMQALRDSLKDKDPSRARVEVAKYVVEDRRAHRRALAEVANKTGATPIDPAVAQLAKLLADQVES